MARRYRLEQVLRLEPPAPPEPPIVVVSPAPAREDARLIFDPALDREQLSPTADRFTLTYVPPSADVLSTPPAVAKILAFPPGFIEPGATLEQVLQIEPIATVEIPVGSFGRYTADLGSLPPGQPYTAALLTGFDEA